jgi:hypothetical protein
MLFFTFCILYPISGFPQSVVRFDGNRFLEVNDQPIFVIGAYDLPSGMTLREGKAMGFNLVRAPAKKEFWDEAHEPGLFVWHSFGVRLDFASETNADKKASIKSTIETFSAHPSLLFWESVDEPAWTDKNPAKARTMPEGLVEGYRYLKSLDANHPVYLNHAPRNMVETLRRYNDACDIVCADIYPIVPRGMRTTYAITPDGRHGDLPNQTPSCVGEFVDKMKRVADPDQAVFIVLQGFSWEAASRKDNPDKALIVYPSSHESRFMAYNAVIHGVNGLLYWGLHSVPREHPFVDDLRRVLNELQALTPVLVSKDTLPNPKLTYHERGSTIAAGIEMLCMKTEDGIYLLAANTSIDPAAVDFTSLPPELKSTERLKVLGEDRIVEIRNGTFFDEFEGLAVHVYRNDSP